MAGKGLVCPVVVTGALSDGQFDGVLVVADKPDGLTGAFQCLQTTISQYQQIDCASCEKEVAVLHCSDLPSKRLIYAPTGPVTRDYDDVRRYQDAAVRGMKRAMAAGCKSPLLILPQCERFPLAARVTLLSCLEAAYTPIEVREARPEKSSKLQQLGVYLDEAQQSADYISTLVSALEGGRVVCRDIGGSDPERMAAPRVADYIEEIFKDTCIKVNIISDLAILEKQYPLLVAVNRAALTVPRHAPRVIHLEYQGEGEVDTTLMLVGKGVTYDTGGADLKVGGVMAGMHRDKCGAAFVAGFFHCLSVWKPKNLKVIGAMCMVRNSIGPDAYVSDEIITSRAGVRVRIGNTDAEGRMAMGDVLCEMKERAGSEVNPYLFTVATLTGHVIRCYSGSYSAVIENGPAKKAGIAQKLSEAGDISADPFEISTLRREDYVAHAGKNEYEDVIQSGGKPSTMTNRGHQSPAAFLVLATGLDKHGNDSEKPLPFSHLDIAGSSGDYPGIPTGSPLLAFAHAYVVNRPSSATQPGSCKV